MRTFWIVFVVAGLFATAWPEESVIFEWDQPGWQLYPPGSLFRLYQRPYAQRRDPEAWTVVATADTMRLTYTVPPGRFQYQIATYIAAWQWENPQRSEILVYPLIGPRRLIITQITFIDTMGE